MSLLQETWSNHALRSEQPDRVRVGSRSILPGCR